MTETIARPRVAFPAWLGWIRAGSGFPAEGAVRADRLELGAAVFSLPEPTEATATSWIRSNGQFCILSGYLYSRGELARELAEDPGVSQAALALEIGRASCRERV